MLSIHATLRLSEFKDYFPPELRPEDRDLVVEFAA